MREEGGGFSSTKKKKKKKRRTRKQSPDEARTTAKPLEDREDSPLSHRAKKRSEELGKGRTADLNDVQEEDEDEDPFLILAEALRSTGMLVSDEDGGDDEGGASLDRIVRAFQSISGAQQAFKGLDGAAHEAYQRTHSTISASKEAVASVSGRASRTASRAAAVADGLGACELCELVEIPQLLLSETSETTDDDSAPEGRQVMVNETLAIPAGKITMHLRVLLLYEPDYRGGAGVEHGGVDDEAAVLKRRASGRLVIVLGDSECRKLGSTLLAIAQSPPIHVRLRHGETGSVQPVMYHAAASVLELVEGPLRTYNASAIHLVGRSLAGGVANLAGAILHGAIPMPTTEEKPAKKKIKERLTLSESRSAAGGDSSALYGTAQQNTTNATDAESAQPQPQPPLKGLGAFRTSVLSVGAPPCLSPNIPTDYITSIVYGDDIVSRASHDALRRLADRTRRNLRVKGGSLGRSFRFVSDAASLAASNLRSHAHGSEGEEARLSVPGRAFLVRPRRLGGACSIHEINQAKGGREALRAAVLWQLNDVLLSQSMWRHHQLESYIHGLDRVQLRGLDDDE